MDAMSHLLPLRKFQREAIDALYAGWAGGKTRLAVVLPTGTGKTVVLAHLAAEHQAERCTRVLILVPTDELVRQTVQTIADVAPHLSVGVVKAAENDVHADVIVASVWTLRTRGRREQIKDVGLVVADECHGALAQTWLDVLTHYGCMDGRTRTAGFTATLARGDGQSLASVWQDVAYTRDISWAIRHRFLIPPRGERVHVPDLDYSRVRTTGGDLDAGDLGLALADSLAPELVAKAYAEHAADRSGVLFAPTVVSATVFADAFNALGITAEVIHGGLRDDERRAIVARLESGATQVVANCQVLTYGFNCTRVSCVVMARQTSSAPLYIQAVGRGLRVDRALPYEGQDCLLLDVVGVSQKMALRSLVDLSDRPLAEATPGKTLIELEDEFDLGKDLPADPVHHYAGPVAITAFDPLAAASRMRWQATKAGVPFVPAGRDAYVFLLPGREPGTHTVAWATKSRPFLCHSRLHDDECRELHGKRGGFTNHADLDLEMAMGWAEDTAVSLGADVHLTYSKKAAPWRGRKASPEQLQEAARLGLSVPAGARAGAASDLINVERASARIDPIAAKYATRQGVK